MGASAGTTKRWNGLERSGQSFDAFANGSEPDGGGGDQSHQDEQREAELAYPAHVFLSWPPGKKQSRSLTEK